MNRRIIIVDDTCKSSTGGTALTIQALLEGANKQFALIETRELNEKALLSTNLDDVWVFGNITDLSQESIGVICAIMMTRTFFKIEFDYGFCKYRGEYGYKYFTGNDKWEPSSNPENYDLLRIYSLIHDRAVAVFYMSCKQMEQHQNAISCVCGESKNRKILGPCVSMNLLSSVLERAPLGKDLFAIHNTENESFGVKSSIAFAKNNKKQFRLIDFLKINPSVLQNVYMSVDGFIFLPNGDFPNSPEVLLSRISGGNVITNENFHHSTEKWFAQSHEDIANEVLSNNNKLREMIN